MGTSDPRQRGRSNCLFFGLALYLRRRSRGHECYLQWRRSRAGWFFHCLFNEYRPVSGLRVISFKPVEPIRRRVPPIVFDGYVAWGDKP